MPGSSRQMAAAAMVLGVCSGTGFIIAGLEDAQECYLSAHPLPFFAPVPCNELEGFVDITLGVFTSLFSVCAVLIYLYRPSLFRDRGEGAE